MYCSGVPAQLQQKGIASCINYLEAVDFVDLNFSIRKEKFYHMSSFTQTEALGLIEKRETGESFYGTSLSWCG